MVNMKRSIKNNQPKRPSIGRVMQLAEAICVSRPFRVSRLGDPPENRGTACCPVFRTSGRGWLDLTPRGHSSRIHSTIRGPSPWLVLRPGLTRRRPRVPSVRLPIDAKNARFPLARGSAAAPRAPCTSGGPNGAPHGFIYLTVEPLGRIPPSPPPPPSLLPSLFLPSLPQNRLRWRTLKLRQTSGAGHATERSPAAGIAQGKSPLPAR